jgi:hypothetical protein
VKSFDEYKGVLPYASEVFGVYQPLLGWKSRIIQRRYESYRRSFHERLAARALATAKAPVRLSMIESSADRVGPLQPGVVDVENFVPLDLDRTIERRIDPIIDGGVARMIQAELGDAPPADWRDVITEDRIARLMERFRTTVSDPEKLRNDELLSEYVEEFRTSFAEERPFTVLEALFEVESKAAGYLLFLARHDPAGLTPMFFATPRSGMIAAAQRQDPLLSFGENGYEAILSPVGIIHLYRQYFFEFDSFLGPPVGHVWLSPGGTVELIEVSTRRALTERSVDQSVETIIRSESETTTRDDIADAVKEENRDSVKFGFTSTGSYSAAVWSASATADLSIEHSTTSARETTHQQMRQQSEKLTSEIKRNFKTTFKTTTEITDTVSKRYVISNTTSELVNYELRRTMRKVGVQVQDIGVALCWHTFVDDAGHDLGVAKLVHIGQPPELGELVQPDAPQIPASQPQEVSITIPFVGIDTDDVDNEYTDGTETESGGLDLTEHIQADFDQRALFATPGFTLIAVDVEPEGFDARLSVRNLQSAEGSSAGTFTVHIDYVAWGGKDQIPVKMVLHWSPSQAMRDAITDEYNKRLDEYSAEKARRFKEAYFQAARERIKLASNIVPRPAEDLREEERTVVYRALISQLMSVGTHESKHITSELVRSIFDVDKMLYFVAPEWWAPRLHRSSQRLGEPPGGEGGGGRSPVDTGSVASISESMATRLHARFRGQAAGIVSSFGSPARGNSISAENIVDWGGARELNRDNYYITEDSRPAKLGSSLGWLLQLDGDNLRNAFLNSPWVKAVIPIRIGKEREALNWLQQAHVEGSDGLDAAYVPPGGGSPAPSDPATVREALERLIEKIQEFDRKSRAPIEGDPADPESVNSHFAGSLPSEAVFENGFYPLQGGVRFDGDPTEQQIISQWMEILPTDQVAALAVKYDPKTLQTVHEDETPEPPPEG